MYKIENKYGFNIKEIQEQFEKVIKNSQSYMENKTINSNSIFASWLKNKRRFIEKFKGLIYEIPGEIEFKLDEKNRDQRINWLIDYIYSDYADTGPLIEFIEANRDCFFENKTRLPFVTSEGITIGPNSKIVKSFKYFVENKEALDNIQTFASRIIQENKIKGTLCLSVHPLDFLSLSENNYNWRSCHALDGDYRVGNLSYMGDLSTCICYLKSENDNNDQSLHRFRGIQWNSKKWRMLFHLNEKEDLIVAGRQYPFDLNLETITEVLLDEVLLPSRSVWQGWSGWNNSLFKEVEIPDDKDEIISLSELHVHIDGLIYPISRLVKNIGDLHFNDVLFSTLYTPSFRYDHGAYPSNSINRIKIGSKVKCLHCNEEYLTDSESFFCSDCENTSVCLYCKEEVHSHSGIYDSWSGEMLHDHCWEAYSIPCSSCGSRFSPRQLTTHNDHVFCSYCWSKLHPAENTSQLLYSNSSFPNSDDHAFFTVDTEDFIDLINSWNINLNPNHTANTNNINGGQ